ncbi:MAG TPA: succinate dehydrogenase, hydrophobic membrane anchor protein [Stellaceae bacterium]|nr:succinate dehydrogenase, hydrophobic membrane anchor protein [Stellaceae bacterium]
MSARDDMRTPLGRALGLGSAKEGVQHWWAQRVTAVALVPLVLWFVAALIAHLGAPRAAVFHWLGSPVPAILMLLFLAAAFHHLALGLQVVIEDYVEPAVARIAAIVVMKLIAYGFAVAGAYAVLRIAFGG